MAEVEQQSYRQNLDCVDMRDSVVCDDYGMTVTSLVRGLKDDEFGLLDEDAEPLDREPRMNIVYCGLQNVKDSSWVIGT